MLGEKRNAIPFGVRYVRGAKAASEVVPPAPTVTSGVTRTGVVRTNAADWRTLRDNWDVKS